MSQNPSHRTQPKSYTVWERLEPLARNYNLTDGLRAPIADPAWLLARQWQFGEFRGNDGGSPVAVDLEYVQETLSSVELPPESQSNQPTPVPYSPNSSPPLESVVERERVLTDEKTGPNYRIRLEAGMNFLSRLRRQREDSDVSPSAFDQKVTLGSNGETVDLWIDTDDATLDDAGRRFALVAGDGRALDGYGIYRALAFAVPGIVDGNPTWSNATTSALPLPDDANNSVSSAFKTAATNYAAWYVDLYAEPDDYTTDTWNENRLEYEFSATTDNGGASTTFEVPAYDGEGLDWDEFEADATSTGNPSTVSPDPMPTPTRLTFRGMPKPRYWEMEDRNVDLSALSAAPEDVSWLTMAEIALTAGTKWYQFPLPAPYGSLTRITRFEVLDTFIEHPYDEETDETTTIEAETPIDPSEAARNKGWNAFLFDLPSRAEPGLWLPPVLGSTLRSDPVERVRFARDESANLVFAIEQLAEGPLGDPLDREEFDRPDLEVADVHPSSEADKEYVEFRNPGDDALDLEDWILTVTVTSGTFDFDGRTLQSGGHRTVQTFSDVTVEPTSSIRLYTGGSSQHDTDDRLHIGANKPLWGRGKQLTSYRVAQPAPSSIGSHETVLEKPVGTVADSSLPRYQLATDVPDYWFPMKALDTGPDDYRLKVALLLDRSTLEDTAEKFPRPMGQVLTPSATVNDEAITDQGTTVERHYTLALGADGSGHLWSSRTVDVGSGRASSGLRFDFLEESAPDGGGG